MKSILLPLIAIVLACQSYGGDDAWKNDLLLGQTWTLTRFDHANRTSYTVVFSESGAYVLGPAEVKSANVTGLKKGALGIEAPLELTEEVQDFAYRREDNGFDLLDAKAQVSLSVRILGLIPGTENGAAFIAEFRAGADERFKSLKGGANVITLRSLQEKAEDPPKSGHDARLKSAPAH